MLVVDRSQLGTSLDLENKQKKLELPRFSYRDFQGRHPCVRPYLVILFLRDIFGVA